MSLHNMHGIHNTYKHHPICDQACDNQPSEHKNLLMYFSLQLSIIWTHMIN